MRTIITLVVLTAALFAGADDFEEGGFQQYNDTEYTGDYKPEYNLPDQPPEKPMPDFSGEGDVPAPEHYSL